MKLFILVVVAFGFQAVAKSSHNDENDLISLAHRAQAGSLPLAKLGAAIDRDLAGTSKVLSHRISRDSHWWIVSGLGYANSPGAHRLLISASRDKDPFVAKAALFAMREAIVRNISDESRNLILRREREILLAQDHDARFITGAARVAAAAKDQGALRAMSDLLRKGALSWAQRKTLAACIKQIGGNEAKAIIANESVRVRAYSESIE